jgi:adenylate kinase
VDRLDGYEVEKPEIFERTIEFTEGKMMPIVVRHAVSGIANINSEDRLFVR